MANALDPGAHVYEGVWTDWSKGSSRGLTWTLSPTRSIILTNAMALFVALTGVQLWTIVRYILHQMRAPPMPVPLTPHLHKQQVILRNAGSDIATARLMLAHAWSSRRSTGKRSKTSYLIGVFAVSYTLLFMTAGVFSNKAINTGSVNGDALVLARSKNCGIWNGTYQDIVEDGDYSNLNEFGIYIQHAAKLAQDVQISLEYAQSCYSQDQSRKYLPSICSTFKVPNLAWKAEDGPCPFAPYMCHSGSPSIVLDTGHIDTHDTIGINAKPSDRLKYRRITTCAVLNDTYHVSGWNGSVTSTTAERREAATAEAFYGPSLYKETNWTYAYSNFASFYDNFSAQVTTPYQLDSERAFALADPQYSTSDFEPIAELAQEAADLTLLFLSFTGTYMGQVDDPWFSAHQPGSFASGLPFLQTRYSRDTAISTLGCTEQHEFCTHDNICTGLGGYDQVQNSKVFINALSPYQNATFDRMLRAVSFSSLPHVVENLALTTTPMLASNETLSGGSGAFVSKPLPETQWQREITFWHSISMAQLQQTIVEWATGQIAPQPQEFPYLVQPIEAQDIWFCNNVMVPSNVYSSFSLVSVIVIVVIGTMIIIASFTINSIAAAISKCLGRPKPRVDWDQDDLLRDSIHWKIDKPLKDKKRSANAKRSSSTQDEVKDRLSNSMPSNSASFPLSSVAERRRSMFDWPLRRKSRHSHKSPAADGEQRPTSNASTEFDDLEKNVSVLGVPQYDEHAATINVVPLPGTVTSPMKVRWSYEEKKYPSWV
jgi:hypothetical protein